MPGPCLVGNAREILVMICEPPESGSARRADSVRLQANEDGRSSLLLPGLRRPAAALLIPTKRSVECVKEVERPHSQLLGGALAVTEGLQQWSARGKHATQVSNSPHVARDAGANDQ